MVTTPQDEGDLVVENLAIEGALRFVADSSSDERGRFMTLWDAYRWPRGMPFEPTSAHLSHNRVAGTLRGLHYQRAPGSQEKLVACSGGRIFDVIVDLRPSSSTYLRWHGQELAAERGDALFVPKGCAHGFVTLEPHTTVTYLIAGAYEPAARAIVRWDDPRFAISWPVREPLLSRADRDAPDFVA